MLAQIFLKKKPTFWPGGLSVVVPPPIEFDAAVRELHGVRFAWTGSPVENGQFFTDHGIELPTDIAIDVVASTHTDTVIPNVQKTRPTRLYQKLLALARTKTPWDLVTSVEIYTSMVFDTIALPRVGPSGAFIITCQAHKLEIATIDVAQNLADAALAIALGEQDLGAIAAAAETSVAA